MMHAWYLITKYYFTFFLYENFTLMIMQLCRELIRQIDSDIAINFDCILEWVVKFEKLLNIQSKSQYQSQLDVLDNDG